MSHSNSRVEQKGGRGDSDPDRRVKYTLRYVRRGPLEEVRSQLVRRSRRREERQLAAGQDSFLRRAARRKERRLARLQVQEELGEA